MNLKLSLKKEWFDLAKKQIKKEDYLDINCYWFKMLVFDHEVVFKYLTRYEWDYVDDQSLAVLLQKITSDKLKSNTIGFKPFDTNIIKLRHPKKSDKERILELEHKGIEIGRGNPEWGAEEGKNYFIVRHGEIIQN